MGEGVGALPDDGRGEDLVPDEVVRDEGDKDAADGQADADGEKNEEQKDAGAETGAAEEESKQAKQA